MTIAGTASPSDRKADAKTWLAAAETDQARGQWVDPRGGAMLFGEWADQWLAARLVRATTLACDRGRLRNHLKPAFGDVPLKDMTPLRVHAYIAELTGSRSPATVRHIHALLSAILGEAVEEGLLLSNSRRRTKLPPPPRYDGVFLSSEQLDRLVDAVDPAYRCLLLTAAGTGMRWGELARLGREHLDLLRRRLRIERTLVDLDGHVSFGEPKTRGSRRTVSLPAPVVDALAAHCATTPPTWSSPPPTARRCGDGTSGIASGCRR